MAVFEAIRTDYAETDLGYMEWTSLGSAPYSNYKHWMIRCTWKTTLDTTGATPYLRINGNTAANYSVQGNARFDGSVYSQAYSGQSGAELGGFSGMADDVRKFGSCELWIPDPSSSGKYPTMQYFTSDIAGSGSGQGGLNGWVRGVTFSYGAQAVTTLRMYSCCSANILQGSEFTFYGLRDS